MECAQRSELPGFPVGYGHKDAGYLPVYQYGSSYPVFGCFRSVLFVFVVDFDFCRKA